MLNAHFLHATGNYSRKQGAGLDKKLRVWKEEDGWHLEDPPPAPRLRDCTFARLHDDCAIAGGLHICKIARGLHTRRITQLHIWQDAARDSRIASKLQQKQKLIPIVTMNQISTRKVEMVTLTIVPFHSLSTVCACMTPIIYSSNLSTT